MQCSSVITSLMLNKSFADLSLEFDECTVLEDNKEYLISTLQLEGIDFDYSENANEKIQEECRPGAPFIVFRVDPSIDLTFINDQPSTGNCIFLRLTSIKKVYNIICLKVVFHVDKCLNIFYRTFYDDMLNIE